MTEARTISEKTIETKRKYLVLKGKCCDLGDYYSSYSDEFKGCNITECYISKRRLFFVISVSPNRSTQRIIEAFKQEKDGTFEVGLFWSIKDVYEENDLDNVRKQWLKESQKPGSQVVKAIEVQPK